MFGRHGAFARWHAPKEPELVVIPPPIPEPIPEPTPQSIELTRVRARLDKLDQLMSEAETDKEWDNYSRAYERMFRAWTWLAGIPHPGSMRPSKAPSSRRPQVQPIEPSPAQE